MLPSCTGRKRKLASPSRIQRMFRGSIRFRLLGALRAFERTHHHIANHQIRFDGADRATGITDVIAWHLLPEARGGPAADGAGLRALR
jgi:hypothetical protein